jgi:hypothetical protein
MARDIVYFNGNGQEEYRVKSNTEFKTYIPASAGQGNGSGYQEVAMPKVAAGYEDPKYQANDYQIAASTAIFNQKLDYAKSIPWGESSSLPTPDANHSVGSSLLASLDVNVVKAMVLQESGAGTVSGATGTGKTDIMQANVSGDWNSSKENIGLTKGQTMTPATSVNAGINILFMKGMSSDKSEGMNWRSGSSGNWDNAVKRYNGGGVPNYLESVKQKYNSMTTATPANY